MKAIDMIKCTSDEYYENRENYMEEGYVYVYMHTYPVGNDSQLGGMPIYHVTYILFKTDKALLRYLREEERVVWTLKKKRKSVR